jgi:hypothetical protein
VEVENLVLSVQKLYDEIAYHAYAASDLSKPLIVIQDNAFDGFTQRDQFIEYLEEKIFTNRFNSDERLTAVEIGNMLEIVAGIELENKTAYEVEIKEAIYSLFDDIESDLLDYNYSSDIDEYRDTVRSLADYAGLSFSDVEDKIEERETELRVKEAEHWDDSDDDWRPDVHDSDDSDIAITSLFSTLGS